MTLKQKTPMKRSPMNRTSSLQAKPKEPKPEKGPKPKKCTNRACRAPYLPDPKQPWKNWCSDDCAVLIAVAKVEAQKAKQQRQERAKDKAKLDSFKTYPQLIAACQKAFNAVVRYRDMLAGHPCISSGVPLNWSGNAVDAGHYRSRGSAPHLRFNFDNCHAQSKQANRYNSGEAVDYRIGLIKRIGLARVEALEADNTPANWTHDDLRQMTKEFQQQLKEMKKGNE